MVEVSTVEEDSQFEGLLRMEDLESEGLFKKNMVLNIFRFSRLYF